MPLATPTSHIPNRVREYRKKRNLRICDVTEFMDLSSPSHVAHWEKGRKLPGLRNALKLAVTLGTMVEVLYSDLLHEIQHEIHAKKETRRNKNQLPLL